MKNKNNNIIKSFVEALQKDCNSERANKIGERLLAAIAPHYEIKSEH